MVSIGTALYSFCNSFKRIISFVTQTHPVQQTECKDLDFIEANLDSKGLGELFRVVYNLWVAL